MSEKKNKKKKSRCITAEDMRYAFGSGVIAIAAAIVSTHLFRYVYHAPADLGGASALVMGTFFAFVFVCSAAFFVYNLSFEGER